MNETKGVDGLTELRKSYEYTLDRIGVDTAAGPVWQEYITFLQSPRVGTPPYHALFGGTHAGQEETQRTLLLRCILTTISRHPGHKLLSLILRVIGLLFKGHCICILSDAIDHLHICKQCLVLA